MKLNRKSVATLLVAASLASTLAFAGEPAQSGAKHTAASKQKKAPKPTVDEQIQALRQEFQGQIDGLKTDLSAKDAELKQAQQAAADAQAAAARAQEAASAQQQANTDNAAAVTSLQSTVDDMRNVNATVVSSLTDDMSKTAKKSELSDIAYGKFKIGATIFADWSYWSDYDGSTAFIDNQTKPTSTADKNYNAFELTRTYFNLLFTPTDAVSVRVTPDISRNSDGNLYFRLKYGYIEFNKPFAFSKSMKKDKITFGQMQQPLTDWEEGLTGHRYTYKMPMDFSSGLSSSYVGAKVRGPIEFNGKEYLDYDLGVFTNGAYSTTEKSATKQFMGRLTAYPFGTKADRTGLGVTIFGNVGFNNVAPSAAATSQYSMDRTVFMAFYQTTDKAYLLSGQYDLSHNIKANGNKQQGYAFEGHARLGRKSSPFQAFGMYQHYEPYNDNTISSNNATKYARTVGGIAYKFNKYFDISLADSNLHYEKAAGLNDANAVSIFTQYTF